MSDRKLTSSPGDSGEWIGTEEIAAIPLVEERLSIAKRQVECGRVRVHVTVDDHVEIAKEQLLRDELRIERVPKNVRITEAPSVRSEGDTMIVPVVAEVLVVEKALMLVEEIHICRHSVAEAAEIPVRVRTEHATVDHETVDDPPGLEE